MLQQILFALALMCMTVVLYAVGSIWVYTTVGNSDVILRVSWRLLGPIDAVVGVLMLGWSTSIIVAAVYQMYNARLPNAS